MTYFILQASWSSLNISFYVNTNYYELLQHSRRGQTITTLPAICNYWADHRIRLGLASFIAGLFRERKLKYDRDGEREGIKYSFYAFYRTVWR